jgi:hypothetical protein
MALLRDSRTGGKNEGAMCGPEMRRKDLDQQTSGENSPVSRQESIPIDFNGRDFHPSGADLPSIISLLSSLAHIQCEREGADSGIGSESTFVVDPPRSGRAPPAVWSK